MVGVYANSTGTKLVTFKYDAYGNCTVSGDESLADYCKIRYRGYYFDTETGLYWVQTRYYNPEWCRWISPDSLSYLDAEAAHGLNLYVYCCDDPVNYVDPSGHFVIFLSTLISYILIGAAVGAVASAGAAYISDVSENVKKDGFQWSDLNTFEDNWQHYLGAAIGGAISGAGIGLCSVVGAGLGVAFASGTALYIGNLAVSASAAVVACSVSAFAAGALGYAARTMISDQETYNVTNMFIEACGNMLSGLTSMASAFVGGGIGIKVPGKRSIKNLAIYHGGAALLGVYVIKALIAKLEESLKGE